MTQTMSDPITAAILANVASIASKDTLTERAIAFAVKAHGVLGVPTDKVLEDEDRGGTLFYVLTLDCGRVFIQIDALGRVLDVISTAKHVPLTAFLDEAVAQLGATSSDFLGTQRVISFRDIHGNSNGLLLSTLMTRLPLPKPITASFGFRAYRPAKFRGSIDRSMGFSYSLPFAGYLEI